MVAEYYDVMLDDKVVFIGTNHEIARRYGMQQSFRANHFIKQGWKLKRIYTLVPHSKDVPIITDPLYEQTKWLIETYRNAYLRNDAERIQKKLKKVGINTKMIPTSDRKGCVLWQV